MEEWDKSQPGNLVGNSLVGTCLILPNLGFLWVFFKYPKISNNGNLLFFPVNAIKYPKIPKISPRCYIFQRPFLRGLICLKGLILYYLKFRLIKCRGMKIFEWIKLLGRHLRQIQGNWGGRNFELPHVWFTAHCACKNAEMNLKFTSTNGSTFE